MENYANRSDLTSKMSANNEQRGISTAVEVAENSSEMEREQRVQSTAPQAERAGRRSHRNTHSTDDESWWTAIEHDDLILDEIVPSRLISIQETRAVSTTTTATTSATTTNPTVIEDRLVLEQNNFDRLHKIADKIKSTLNEHIRNQAESLTNQQQFLSEGVIINSSNINPAINPSNSTTIASTSTTNTNTTSTTRGHSIPMCSSLEEFKADLELRRKTRQHAVQELRDEIHTLRHQLQIERDLTRRLRNGSDFTENTDSSSNINTIMAVQQQGQDEEEEEQEQQKQQKQQKQQETSSLSTIEGDLLMEGLLMERSILTIPPTIKKLVNVNDLKRDEDTDDDADPLSRSRHANIELANAQLALQMANSENISLRSELAVVQKQVGTLKEVISCCKQMLSVKEEQCNEVCRQKELQSKQFRCQLLENELLEHEDRIG